MAGESLTISTKQQLPTFGKHSPPITQRSSEIPDKSGFQTTFYNQLK